MSDTGEDDQLICLQKFSSGDNLFLYYSKKNVVGLLQSTQDSADTPEAEIQDEDEVNTMGYDMLE